MLLFFLAVGERVGADCARKDPTDGAEAAAAEFVACYAADSPTNKCRS